ncbi:MAG TPA: hypothetical protein VJR05_02310 [Acidimicrobiia bacterium]|nr:hypothetical protein [Acidimicrobiia bacterium]
MTRIHFVVALTVLIACSTSGDEFELGEADAASFCPVYAEVLQMRAGDTLDAPAVDRLIRVLPSRFRDDARLFFYPLAGPVFDLAQTGGVDAQTGGQRLALLYETNCL